MYGILTLHYKVSLHFSTYVSIVQCMYLYTTVCRYLQYIFIKQYRVHCIVTLHYKVSLHFSTYVQCIFPLQYVGTMYLYTTVHCILTLQYNVSLQYSTLYLYTTVQCIFTLSVECIFTLPV